MTPRPRPSFVACLAPGGALAPISVRNAFEPNEVRQRGYADHDVADLDEDGARVRGLEAMERQRAGWNSRPSQKAASVQDATERQQIQLGSVLVDEREPVWFEPVEPSARYEAGRQRVVRFPARHLDTCVDVADRLLERVIMPALRHGA